MPAVDEADITLPTLEKMVLMLVATLGIMAPAATATKPAINAYSIKSWPRVSFQIRSCHTSFMTFFICIYPRVLIRSMVFTGRE